jgi:hypothetical protein
VDYRVLTRQPCSSRTASTDPVVPFTVTAHNTGDPAGAARSQNAWLWGTAARTARSGDDADGATVVPQPVAAANAVTTSSNLIITAA